MVLVAQSVRALVCGTKSRGFEPHLAPKMGNKTYKGEIESLSEKQIFVFGSNTQGRHGKGGALKAKQKFGAIYGQAEGLQGQSYAIITKDISSYPHKRNDIMSIVKQIIELYRLADTMTEYEFYVCYAGSGTNLNGYSPKEMASMFAKGSISENIVFEEEFYNLILAEKQKLMDLVKNYGNFELKKEMKKEEDNL